MNQKKLVIIFSAIALFVILMAIFIAWRNKTPAIVKSPAPIAGEATSTESEWKLYENTKYGYRFMYPSEGGVYDNGINATKRSDTIIVGIPYKEELIRVSAWIFNESPFRTTKKELNAIITLPLDSFAETVYRFQVEDKEPNFKNKEIGSLEKITFKGKAAYQFTLTKGFSNGPLGGSYAFFGGTHNYILFEHSNAKFIMHYPLEDKLSQKLVDSFITTIATVFDESSWKPYENTKYGYRFMYPSEGFAIDEGGMEYVEKSSDLVVPMEGTRLIGVSARTPCTALPQSKGGCGGDVILPLHSFAETVHRYQVEDTNPNFKDKEVGDLKQLTFKGKAAYQFTLTRSFSDGPLGGGYSFSGGTHNYILFEHNNTKFVIHYPLENNLSQKVLNSLEFVSN